MARTNKRRENIRSAIESVKQVFSDNSETVSGLAALSEAVTKFDGDYAIYLKGEEAFGVAMNGKTTAKHEAEETLTDVLYPLGRALRSYAKKADKHDIFELVDVEEYELDRMRDTDLVEYAKTVLKRANEVGTELAKYNVTPEELADVQSKLDAYDKALKAQGGGMAARSSEFAAMVDALQTVKDDLEDIDDIMERVRKDNPKFYDAYNSARRVKALGTRHNPAPAASAGTQPQS